MIEEDGMGGYRRVLPRDLFNEADLLRNLGRLWIALDETPDHRARFEQEDVARFDVVQDESSGAIRVANLGFTIGGRDFILERPLNSRSKWPLVLESDDDPDTDPVRVFTEEGDLSEDMLALIRR